MIEQQDPRPTAYVLGELDAKEVALIEQALRENKDFEIEVKAIREVATALRDTLQQESTVGLTPQQKENLMGLPLKKETEEENPKLMEVDVEEKPRKRKWLGLPAYGLAASVLVVGLSIVMFQKDLIQSQIGNLVLPAEDDIVGDYIFPATKKKPAVMDGKREVRSKNAQRAEGKVRTRAMSRPSARGANKKFARKLRKGMPMLLGRSQVMMDESVAMSGKRRVRGYGGLAPPVTFASDAIGTIAPTEEQGDYTTFKADREAYDEIVENRFLNVQNSPLSTFSIDVDTASYTNLRRMLNQGVTPPRGAIRIDELINYFDYAYKAPTGKHPFAVHVEVAKAPWKSENKIVRIGLQGKNFAVDKRPASNLVFLIDVSGSMRSAAKLDLVKTGFRKLVKQLNENDKVAIVVYAGSSGAVLEPTSGENTNKIIGALDKLNAGGSTNGAAGIQLAYQLAQKHFIKGGVNRVILATDGDFNVGTTSRSGLVDLVKEKAKKGVFLTVLGFGMGNLNDAMMEQISNKGNGNYFYIDTEREAEKVFVKNLAGTFVTIAKDVKIQVEFNPAKVESYRLIGYENRRLNNEDFADDKKDAGEIGAGHNVTALYEIVPKGGKTDAKGIPLKYQKSVTKKSSDLLTVKLRYKKPLGTKSVLLEVPVKDSSQDFSEASKDFRFASAVAGFGMLLRKSEHAGDVNFGKIESIARAAKGDDKFGYRQEFIELVKKATPAEPLDK